MIKNIRIDELDSLRGLAVILVVLYHYTTRYEEIYGHKKVDYLLDVSYGHYGVELFFMISGFVIFLSLNNISSPKEFIIKRVIRLYPVYIVSVTITFLSVRIYSLTEREVTLFEAIINLSMFQAYLPSIRHVDGAYWSLSVELSFYLLCAIIIYFKKVNKFSMLSLFWLILSFVILYFNDNRYINFIGTKLFIYHYSHLFIIGIMFYKIYMEKKVEYYLIIILALLYELLLNGFEEVLIVGFFVLVFTLLINNSLIFLNIKILRFFGTISYALYLIHQNMGYIILHYLENKGLVNETFILIPISVSIFLAIILTYLVEKPFQKYLRNLKYPVAKL